jgi:outer membrane biosynthesis protein TonB
MKNFEINSEKEEKNKKKGLAITMFVHFTVIALAFFPLMSASTEIELSENTIEFVELQNLTIEDNEVDFVVNAEDKTRKNESSEESKTKEENDKPEPTPTPEPAPDPKPVEVAENDETPVVSGENTKATEVKTVETPKVEPITEPTPTVSNPSGTPSDENKPGGTANNNTNASGDGGNDDDLQEGVFGRKVMKRPNIKGLTKERGKVAIKVCISQQGTVIASKYLPKFTTLKDPQLIASAMRAVRYYKFDVDYTAPKKQWGKLTFIFDI